MRVLLLIQSLAGGGAERVTCNLANYWASKGFEVTVVTLAPESGSFYSLLPPVRHVSLDLSTESTGLLSAIINNIRRVNSVRRVLKQVRPNVAIGMMTAANVLLALARIGISDLMVYGSERTYPPRMPLGRMWELMRRLSYGRLSGIVAVTDGTRRWLLENTSAKRVDVIPNAAFWPLPMHKPLIQPDSLVRSGRKTLLAVGRLGPEKGFDVLISVFSRLASVHPDWDLIILGEGELRPALEAQVRALSIGGRVHLPGRAGNVGAWYEVADLYVMTSAFEGFPNTLVEAMAYGLAAVSFDCDTGPRDIIRNEVDGLLVPPGDAAALENALARLMADSNLRKQLATRAQDVRTRFSVDSVVSRWEQLFGEQWRRPTTVN